MIAIRVRFRTYELDTAVGQRAGWEALQGRLLVMQSIGAYNFSGAIRDGRAEPAAAVIARPN